MEVAERQRYSGDPQFYDDKQHETYQSMQERTILVGEAMQQAVLRGRMVLPTKLLVIPRGSYFMADTITRMMKIGSLDNMMFAAKSYDDATNTSGTLEIGQQPTRDMIEGESILIVDEVCETGKTLFAAHKMADDLGAAAVTSAVVHYKPRRTETGYVPDYYAEMTDKWIVYPSEQVDVLGDDFQQRLVAAGFTLPGPEVTRLS